MKNLAYVVALVKMDLDDFSSHGHKKLCQYATDGYKELGFKGDNRVKTCYITPNDVYKGELPNDFATHTKVGMNFRGEWITLTKNDNLFTKVPTDCCGDDIFNVFVGSDTNFLETPLFDSGFNFMPHWRAGNYVAEMYSASGGFSNLGSFAIDLHNNIVQFDPRYPKMTYAIEYVSDGSDADGSTLIPSICVKPIRNWIKYEIEANKRKPFRDPGLVNELWGTWNRSIQDFKDQMYLPTIEECCDWSYAQYQSSPKR